MLYLSVSAITGAIRCAYCTLPHFTNDVGCRHTLPTTTAVKTANRWPAKL